jgi:dTDP-4-amino-4,6-dideoxygalactose transaminase
MKQHEHYQPPKFGKGNIRNPIPLFSVFMSEKVGDELLKVLYSGFIGQGVKVDEFEQVLAGIFDNKNVLTVNSGTAALHLAFRLAGVGPGKEVITTPMTCTATNMPILANGGKIVWADVDPDTGLIDPVDVERKINENTVAIVGVDWGGTPCDWDELNRIGKQYGVKTIDDAAHGLGMTYKGRKAGTLADYTIFSFQAIKHITTIDGGALVVRSTEDYVRGKLLRWYGIDRDSDRKDFRCEEDIKEWGYKFHMNDINATVGIEQFKHLESIVGKHKDNALSLIRGLSNYFKFASSTKFMPPVPVATKDKGVVSVEPGSAIAAQHSLPNIDSSYWLLTLVLQDSYVKDEFMKAMKEKGIMVSSVHARNDTHTCFAESKSNLPGVGKFTSRQVSIPVHWSLTKEEIAYMIKTMNEWADDFEIKNIF